MIFSIYKSTNKISGKSYIGFTYNLEKRKSLHKRMAFSKTSKSYKSHFAKAIRKYGFESFEWEILFQSTDKQFILNEMETHFINEFNTFTPNGYNMTFGGEGSLGKKYNKIIKQKNPVYASRAEALRQRNLKNNPMNNPDTREKMRQSLLGRKKFINEDGTMSYRRVI